MEPLLKHTPILGPISNHEKNLSAEIWTPLAIPDVHNPARLSAYWIEEQNSAMLEQHPDFRIVFRTEWGIAWKGYIAPAFKKYEILILYVPGADYSDYSIREQSVAIFSTVRLDRREGHPDEPVPHRYLSKQFDRLCLYHPAKDAWSPYKSLIATDIINFTSQWLLTYEFWHLTGKWLAPGAHPENKDESTQSPALKKSDNVISFDRFGKLLYVLPIFYSMGFILPKIIATANGPLVMPVREASNSELSAFRNIIS